MDASERELLAVTLRDAIGGAGDAVDAVDQALDGLGWLEMLDAEPDDAIALVFETLGHGDANATALDDVVVAALGLKPRADLAVMLPPFATWQPPGAGTDGLATARVATASELLVVAAGGCTTVPMSAAHARAVRGVDPTGGWHTVRVDDTNGTRTDLDAAAWDNAVARARRAVAHQVAGACRTMLDLARGHALERVQFGHPIAQFQAVRHRLAEALVAVETLEAALGAAADEPGPVTAALAKAIAGRSARTVAAHCQQVLAGIGFTTDHPFHRYLKRTIALDGLFGPADEIVVDLGRRLVAARNVPTLIEL
jgi:hypothetical protein